MANGEGLSFLRRAMGEPAAGGAPAPAGPGVGPAFGGPAPPATPEALDIPEGPEDFPSAVDELANLGELDPVERDIVNRHMMEAVAEITRVRSGGQAPDVDVIEEEGVEEPLPPPGV